MMGGMSTAAVPVTTPESPVVTAVPRPYEPPVAAWAGDAPALAAYRDAMALQGPTTTIHVDRKGAVRTDEGYRVVAFDTETGGFSPDANALLSVATIAVDRRFAAPWSAYVVPPAGLSVDERALAVNGLTPDVLAERGAVEERQAMLALRDMLLSADAGRPVAVVAHRVAFDVAFVDAAAARHGVDIPIAQILDTHPVCKTLRDKWPTSAYAEARNTLDTFRSMLLGQQDARGVHTAEEDTASLAACVRVLAHRNLPVASTMRQRTPPAA